MTNHQKYLNIPKSISYLCINEYLFKLYIILELNSLDIFTIHRWSLAEVAFLLGDNFLVQLLTQAHLPLRWSVGN